VRRIQFANNDAQSQQRTNKFTAGYENAPQRTSGQSWDRFQNNNVSSTNPSKALVSPRGPNQPQVMHFQLQQSNQIVRSIFKEQVPSASQGISSAKNATSQPVMFPSGNNKGSRAQVLQHPNGFPTLNQVQESPRTLQKKNQVQGNLEISSRPNFHQSSGFAPTHLTATQSNPPQKSPTLGVIYSQ